MATASPQEVAAKWQRNIAGSTDAVRRGIERVNESPTHKAAQQEDLYLRKVQESVSSGKRKAALERVSLEQWKQAALQKGVGRIASGAQAAQGKMERFLSEFLPFVERNAAEVRSMPKGTLADSQARAARMIELNSKFRRSS